MDDDLRYIINPKELDVNDLYDFLVYQCKYFDVVLLGLMLNSSKELITNMKKELKNE